MQRREPRTRDGIIQWQCPTCARWLPASSFYRRRRAWNGISAQCRTCHIRGSIDTREKANKNRLNRESMRRLRAKDPGKFRAREREASGKRPRDERYHARQLVYHALKLGLLAKPATCQICSRAIRLTAHHPDHAKPLDVEWLCYECHGNR